MKNAAEHVTFGCRAAEQFLMLLAGLFLHWQPICSGSLGSFQTITMSCYVGTGKCGLHHHRVNRGGDNWVWIVERNPFPGGLAVLWSHPVPSGMVSCCMWKMCELMGINSSAKARELCAPGEWNILLTFIDPISLNISIQCCGRCHFGDVRVGIREGGWQFKCGQHCAGCRCFWNLRFSRSIDSLNWKMGFGFTDWDEILDC